MAFPLRKDRLNIGLRITKTSRRLLAEIEQAFREQAEEHHQQSQPHQWRDRRGRRTCGGLQGRLAGGRRYWAPETEQEYPSEGDGGDETGDENGGGEPPGADIDGRLDQNRLRPEAGKRWQAGTGEKQRKRQCRKPRGLPVKVAKRREAETAAEAGGMAGGEIKRRHQDHGMQGIKMAPDTPDGVPMAMPAIM